MTSNLILAVSVPSILKGIRLAEGPPFTSVAPPKVSTTMSGGRVGPLSVAGPDPQPTATIAARGGAARQTLNTGSLDGKINAGVGGP
jgi:hypothetical protein